MQHEASRAWRDAHEAGKRLPVLSLDTELCFDSSEERARFADALAAAVTRVVAEHAHPCRGPASRGSRPFRLVLGCYPIPSAPPKDRP
jgi:hypothetical protein